MLFQDDLGVENGGQNEVNIVLTSSLSAFQDALGAKLPLEAILASIFDTEIVLERVETIIKQVPVFFSWKG